MTEETLAVTSAAQAAANTDDEATAEAQAAEAGGESISLDEARKLRREAQSLRKRLADLEKQDTERKQAELSEAEKAKANAAKLEEALTRLRRETQEQVIRYEVMLRASALHVVDPDAAVRLLDLSELEAGEDGAVNGDAVDKALRALLKAKPYLVKQETAPAPETNARNGKQREADAAAREEELKRRYRI